MNDSLTIDNFKNLINDFLKSNEWLNPIVGNNNSENIWIIIGACYTVTIFIALGLCIGILMKKFKITTYNHKTFR